ncbi:MAG: FtsQ-type POTRA domain-containing protein, partial [Lentisphaerae bacterium]
HPAGAQPVDNTWRIFFVRLIVWGGVIGGGSLAIILGLIGLRELFFTRNPYYKLRHVQIVCQGNIPEKMVRDLSQLRVGEDYLFAIDIKQIRERLCRNLLIKDAFIMRRYPDTIQITVTGRSPIAQFLTCGGLSVDAEGYVLPPASLVQRKVLPVIVGLPELVRLRIGRKVENEHIGRILKFLEAKSRLDENNIFRFKTLIVDSQAATLHVRLLGNAHYFIAGGARLDLPLLSLEENFLKALQAVKYRSLARQWTASIDARYQRTYIRRLP